MSGRPDTLFSVGGVDLSSLRLFIILILPLNTRISLVIQLLLDLPNGVFALRFIVWLFAVWHGWFPPYCLTLLRSEEGRGFIHRTLPATS